MSINIKIRASVYEGQSQVSWGGDDIALISPQERNTFKLNDSQLKYAAQNELGRRPEDAFLRSPTPWNLYEDYRWMQTQRRLFIQNVRLLERSTHPVIVASQEFVNSSSVTAKFNAGIEQSVANTVSSQWSTGGTLSIGQTIKVEVGFLGTGGSSETSLSYEQSWGIGGEQSQTITVGSSSGVEVELEPGQAVVAELMATRGVMRLEFNYIASLNGVAALNYNPPHRGRHFYGINVPYLMQRNNISNAIRTLEIIEVGYFTESRIIIKDKKTGYTIKEFSSYNLDESEQEN
ncbi:hypothetical protein ACIP8G_00190 [Serratia liquefaciens]|uniref:hypothetical protein n=1 Tax=Serratia liquefaciens TaxID=614 RepID=UPI00382588EC